MGFPGTYYAVAEQPLKNSSHLREPVFIAQDAQTRFANAEVALVVVQLG